MGELKRVLIMAGGTGGHVFPGLAVAAKLKSQGVEVRWLGTHRGLESKLVPDAGILLSYIGISGWRGKSWRTLLAAPFKLLLAIWQAAQVIRKFKPDVILGLGGFVSGPGGIASVLMRYPLVIHEQNSIAGMTNRFLARFSKRILTAFPETLADGFYVGNPVRDAVLSVGNSKQKTWPLSDRPLRLLVLGGSQGAAAINSILPAAIAQIPEEIRPEVFHQSGEKNFSDSMTAWQSVGVNVKVQPFIKNIDEAYAWADFVLARAGALTIAELCAAGRGAYLVPYPYAVDDHQAVNADFMVKAGAAIMIRQVDLSVAKLVDLLSAILSSPRKAKSMGEAAYSLNQGDASEKIIKVCQEVCH